MAHYTIIGGDGKEYGPVSEQDLKQWVVEGRLAALSLAKGEGDAEFRPLEKFPELAALFAPAAPGVLGMAATPPPIEPPKTPPTFAPASASSNALPDDYELDIMGCLSRGFDLLKENMGTLFVGALIYCAIQVAVGMFGSIPIIGMVFSIANFICAGPLLAGLFYLFIRVNRGEAASVGDVFAGFRRGFAQLFLARLVQVLIAAACFLPLLALFGMKILSVVRQLQSIQPGSPPDPEIIRSLTGVFLAAFPIGLVCAIPAMFFSVCFIFALPLIIDRQVNFMEGLKTSWRMVLKHWFLVFGLLALVGILNVVGMMLCCVPVLFTLPVGIGALACAYETIFGTAKK
jgi:uncharacterized membrane protein